MPALATCVDPLALNVSPSAPFNRCETASTALPELLVAERPGPECELASTPVPLIELPKTPMSCVPEADWSRPATPAPWTVVVLWTVVCPTSPSPPADWLSTPGPLPGFDSVSTGVLV